jgi:hypothetical protein
MDIRTWLFPIRNRIQEQEDGALLLITRQRRLRRTYDRVVRQTLARMLSLEWKLVQMVRRIYRASSLSLSGHTLRLFVQSGELLSILRWLEDLMNRMKHTARRRGIYFYSWVNLIRQLRKLEAKIKQVLYPLNLSETSEAEVRHELVSNPAKCSVYARHAKVIKEIVRDLQQDDKLDELAAGFESAILKHWQNELNIYLKERPSERRVIWFTDVIGNTGKTWMSRYLLATLRENCIRLENSKSDNIKYAYNGERVVIFDYSRSQADHVNYEVIESVKNGIMFSGKYESCSKTFDIPHVVIFANFEPDLTKLSADRWDVRHFTEED